MLKERKLGIGDVPSASLWTESAAAAGGGECDPSPVSKNRMLKERMLGMQRTSAGI